MELSSVLQLLFIICAFVFIIGLIRPGFVVFWSANKSRSSVLAVWGLATAILGITYFILTGSREDTRKSGFAPTEQRTYRG